MPEVGWIGLTEDRNKWMTLVNVASWNLLVDVRAVRFTLFM